MLLCGCSLSNQDKINDGSSSIPKNKKSFYHETIDATSLPDIPDSEDEELKLLYQEFRDISNNLEFGPLYIINTSKNSVDAEGNKLDPIYNLELSITNNSEYIIKDYVETQRGADGGTVEYRPYAETSSIEPQGIVKLSGQINSIGNNNVAEYLKTNKPVKYSIVFLSPHDNQFYCGEMDLITQEFQVYPYQVLYKIESPAPENYYN